VETAQYLQHLRPEGEALARAADGNLGARVPPCPEWTVADLVDHVIDVHWFWRNVAEGSLQSPAELTESRDRPSDDHLLDVFREELDRLVGILADADPSTAVWTWSSQNDVAFIQRRMAQETAVHRWDAEAATRTPDPIDAELAIDGVDEFLDLFLCHPEMAKRFDASRSTVHLHSTDAPGEWLIETGGGAVRVAREHGKGDVAVRAPASDLLLLLWRRRGPDDLEVFGDMGALVRFLGNCKVE
jgi:uncharacterized protein (TIGR03083 family)